ncbi:MAG: hypothetical protein ACJ8M1_07935 [Chthoniobacterales bacterium]
MPLSSIVRIVIRLFALNWCLQALNLMVSAAALSHDRPLAVMVMRAVPGVLFLILAIALWILAAPVARFVSRGVDANVNLAGLSRSDLYSFAFVFLGLFFVLSSIAHVINWIHYFATAPSADPTRNPRVEDFYQLTRPFLTLVAGLVSLIGAPLWTKKLVNRERKTDAAEPQS